MSIGGIQKTSFIDYPDKLSTVLFFRGCNFKCPYCHNAELISFDGKTISEKEVLQELSKRIRYIDSVVISGGECTLSDKLMEIISEIRSIGYNVKLDTNGTMPGRIKELIDHNLLDYIAMDIKAPLGKYEQVAGVPINLNKIKNSVNLIMNQMDKYEFRTTVSLDLLTKEDIIEIAYWLKGARKFVIQNFSDSENVLCGKNKLRPYDSDSLSTIQAEIQHLFGEVIIR
ncbi:MAG: anaerobic ribonucleoside-triphosphate reductase activating protein [Tindallia sp. MSAO_Bac2]|nr:MAG: anaerobic ribonucleoside-triphosphate reductase activating protein [Tindallia sp. MSAO_Bac2]